MKVNILKGTYLEFEKMKKKNVLIIALLFTLVTIVWTMAVSNNFYSRGETSPSDMWLYGLTSIAQINALLSPIFLSITASKVSEIEHRGATLKILLTRQSRVNLYLSKFVYCEIVASLCTVVQFLGFIVATYFSDFFEAVPVSLMIQSILAVIVVNTMLIAIFFISLYFYKKSGIWCWFWTTFRIIGNNIYAVSKKYSDIYSKLLLYGFNSCENDYGDEKNNRI